MPNLKWTINPDLESNLLDFEPESTESEDEIRSLAESLESERKNIPPARLATAPSEDCLPGLSSIFSPQALPKEERSDGLRAVPLSFGVTRIEFGDEQREEESLPESAFEDEISEYQYREIVVDKNGRPRHAGADCQEGEFVNRLRRAAEQDLYIFCKAVLDRFFLTESLHRPICQYIQKVPPFRKLTLMPREHAKTAIVSGGLPLHIIIQPAETNIYFPGMEGSECRIMLAGENMRMAKKNLRVLEAIHSENKLFRSLWPERVWDQPRRQSKVWNQEALIFPRENEWPDPTIWALGVDGAVTGARPNVMIKDDLISIEASRSEIVMGAAIDWHVASRALLDSYEVESGLQGLEFIIGTRWAVFDLYSYIMDNDPSVEVNDEKYHSIIRDGKILWPEKHTVESINQLRKEHGSNFYLLYMNSAENPELTDFDTELIREVKILGGDLVFEEDERDEILKRKYLGKEDQHKEFGRTIGLRRGDRFDLRVFTDDRMTKAFRVRMGV